MTRSKIERKVCSRMA